MDPKLQKKKEDAGKATNGARRSRSQPNLDDLEMERKWLVLVKKDPEHYEKFVRRYYQIIFKFMFKSLRNHDLATELTNDTFSAAWSGIKTFQWRGISPGAYIVTTANNLLKAHWKRNLKRKEISVDPCCLEIESCCQPEDSMVADESRKQLWSKVGQLSIPQRKTLQYFYLKGLTTKEIAIILAMKEPTVKSHLQRGRAKLKKFYDWEEVGFLEFDELYESDNKATWMDRCLKVIFKKKKEFSWE
jgi:RNA polymerase sigma-70 factor (ECF subfamily)